MKLFLPVKRRRWRIHGIWVQVFRLLLCQIEAITCCTTASGSRLRGGDGRHSFRGLARAAFHKLSWTMAASVHMSFAVLLVSNCIPRAPPFLPISTTTSSRLRISTSRETQMERPPSHYNNHTDKGGKKLRTLIKKRKLMSILLDLG